MTGAERGFLLLTSQLGNPRRRPLSAPQLRTLFYRVTGSGRNRSMGELVPEDLVALGYDWPMARHIAGLLSEEALLQHYLERGRRQGCMPLVRGTEQYPGTVRRLLGTDSPGSLWYRGDLSLLKEPKIALVGSRELLDKNAAFAAEVGAQAARQGYVLVSGNAVGADRTAQNSALAAGGRVISVVADELRERQPRPGMLLLSEDGYDLPFTAQRALSRNRIIHCLGEKTFVAQSSLEKGGTWDGTARNLKFRWSPVFCFRDGSEAIRRLEQMGAEPVECRDLENLEALCPSEESFF